MPKSLKRVDEPDTFDYGKAVTLILDQTKQFAKTRNSLVDDINYLTGRKKQEISSLEKAIADKAEVAKLKQELTEKIIAQKSEFETLIADKRAEMESKESDLALREAELAVNTKKLEASYAERQNELDLRANDFKKEMKSQYEANQKKEDDLISRENIVKQIRAANSEEKTVLDHRARELDAKEIILKNTEEDLGNRIYKLDVQEAALVNKQTQLDEQGKQLSLMAGELENQASLVEREKSKVNADIQAIRSMQKTLNDKKAELENREMHIKDREATALTH